MMAPTQVTLDFSLAVDLATVQASDVTFGGLPATGFTAVDADTLTFQLQPVGSGIHTLAIASGEISEAGGAAIAAFSSQTTVDATAPRIIASSVSQGVVLPAGLPIEWLLTFDEPMGGGTLVPSAYWIRPASGGQIPPLSVMLTGAQSIRVLFAGMGHGNFTLEANVTSSIRDAVGNLLDGEAHPSTTVPTGDGAAGGLFEVNFSTTFEVTATTPASNAVIPSAPFSYLVDFNGSFDASTVQATDLLIDGQPLATSVTVVDANTASFALPALPAGNRQATIAGGAIASSLGAGVTSFARSFTVNSTGPKVITSSILEGGSVSSSSVTYTAAFDRDMTAAGFTTSTVLLAGQSTGPVTASSVSYNAGTRTLTASFTGVPVDQFTLTLVSGAAAIRDSQGLPLDGEANAGTTVPSGDGTGGGDFVVHFSRAMTVAGTSPASGGIVAGNVPFNYTIDFVGAYDPATVQASDLLIDGNAIATGVTLVDADTLRFTIPAVADGSHTASLAAGAVSSTTGVPLTAFSRSFTSSTAPRVVSSSLVENQSTTSTSLIYTATFDQPLTTSDLTSADVTLVGQLSGARSVTSFSYNTSTRTITASLSLASTSDVYTLTLLSSSTGFRGATGLLLDGERQSETTVPSGDGTPGGHFVVHFFKPLTVSSTSPSNGSSISGPLPAFDVNFNGAIDAATLQADDLLIDGAPLATAVTAVDADTIRFSLPTLTDGLHQITLADGAIASTAGVPLTAYSGTLTTNSIGPRVVASSILEGDSLTGGNIIYTATFSEALNSGVLSGADVTLVGQVSGARPSPSFSYNSSTFTITATFTSPPSDQYTLTLLSSTTGFKDSAGNLLDGERHPTGTVPSGDGDTGGDFVLHFSKAFAVASTTPSAGGTLPGGSAFVVNFNGTVDPASVQAVDMLIDGVPATGVSVIDADTVSFTFDPGADGTHTASIPAGAIMSAANFPLGAFSQTFVSNANGPRVTSSSIANGDVFPVGAVAYQASFSEAVDGSVLNFADLSLTTSTGGIINPNVFTLLGTPPNTGVSASFVILTDDIYTLRLNSGTNGFRDLAGSPLDGSPSFPLPSGDGVAGGDFQVTFVVDGGTAPVPISLTPKNPLGAAIHAGTASSTIGFQGDTDVFTLSLDADQAISVTIDPAGGLSTQVELVDPGGATVMSASSTTPGGHAVILDAPVAVGGTYTLRVTGLSGTGRFDVNVLLNASPEIEGQGGAGNDTPGSAQAIGFLDLSSMRRAAIVGALPTITQTVATDSFTSATLGSQWTTNAVGGTGRIQLTSSFTTASGPFAMWMDTTSSQNVTNEAILTIDLSGLTQASLRFMHAEWFDEETSLPAVFSGSAAGDGVSISADGNTWHTVFNATNLSNGSWQQVTIDLDAAAAAAGIELGPNFKIKFQQHGFSSLTSDGRGYDEIAVTAPTFMEDWYEFTLADGQIASIALASLDDAETGLELYDAEGNLLARGEKTGTIERAIQALRDGTSDGDVDTYRVRVAGPGGGEYSLIVTRDGGFELGANGSAQTAQPLTGAVLGYAQLPALGRLFASNGTTIYEINPTTGFLIRSFSMGTVPGSGFGLATTGSSVLAGGASYAPIFELNPDSGSVIRTISNPGIDVQGMAFLDNEIFLVAPSQFPGITPAQIIVLDYATGEVRRTMTTAPLSGHLATDGVNLIGWASNAVQRIDPATGSVTPIGALVASTGFTGMGVIGNELFVGLPFSATMLVYSLEPFALVRTVSTISASAIGADGVASRGYHQFLANAGDSLVIRTATPGGGAFAPVNTLDPAITLIQPDGSTVAHNNVAGNETFTHTAAMTGTYTVRVLPQTSASGEYVLTVTGNTGTSSFAVSSSDPAEGGTRSTSLTTVTIDLNEAPRLDSVQASDLAVDGVPASAVTIVDQDTLVFTVAAPSDGQHEITIAAGALTSLDGRPIAAFSASFVQDIVAPRVVASSILQNDTVAAGTLVYTAQISETLSTSNLDVNDVTITRGGVTLGSYSISYDAPTSTLTATFLDVIEGDYTLRLVSGSTALRDLAGLALDGEPHATMTVPSGNGSAGGDFTVAFKVETTSPVPLAFAVVEPAGARVYEGVAAGSLAAAGDVDIYEFSADAGQTLAAIVEVVGDAQVALELRDVAGQLIRQATAAAGGADVLMQGETLAAGLYRLHLIGAAGAAATSYRLRALLNTDVESERFAGGSDNGSAATAVDLASAMVPLTGNAAIAGFIGRGDQNRSTRTIAGTFSFPNVLTFTFDNLPAATADGTIDITATGDIEAGNETVALNVEGVVTQTLFTTAGTSTRTASVSVTQAQWNTLLADGRLTVTLTPSASVSAFTGNTATVTVNHAPGAVAGDMYRVALTQGESLSASVKARGTGAVTSLQLIDLDGVTVKAVGAAAANSDGAIVDFVAPAAGDYFVRVIAEGEYLLTAGRAAVLDAEVAGAPTDLTSAAVAVGHVSSRNLGRLFGVDLTGASPSIREYLPATGAVIASLPLPFSSVGSQLGLATTASTLLVGSNSQTSIVEIDPATGQTLRTIPLGKNVYALAFVDGEIFAQTASNLIDVIDHASGQVTRQLLTTTPLHLGALTAARGRLLAASSGGGSLLSISPRTGETTVVNSPLSLVPGGLAVVGEELFIPAGSTSMRAYDLDSFALKRTMTIASSSIVALGGDGELADEDLYALQVNVGDVLTLSTSTPADGPAAFANALDPKLELRHATLGLIAADDNGGADGRNAVISHTATEAGTYFVRVIATGGSGGEYALTAQGATGERLPLQVASITPADGSFSAAAVTQITVAFDDSFDVTTVDAGDLTVNGVAATAVAILDGRTAQFSIASPGLGTHAVSLAGIMDAQGMALPPFQSQFTVDTTAPRVTGISVQQNGSVSTGDAIITVQFSEVIAPLTSGGFTLVGASTGSKSAQSFAFDPTTRTLSLQYTGLTEQYYTLTLNSADGAFEDLAGNNLDGEAMFPMPPNQSGNGTAGGNFVVNFHADRGLLAFPNLTLTYGVPPATVASGQATTFLGPGDIDSWSINLDANQVISLSTSVVTGLTFSLTLRDPQGAIVATGTSSSVGKSAFIQTAPVVAAGLYTIEVSNPGGAGTSVTVAVDLNAAIEQEAITGSTNNTAGTAQNIDAAFVGLGLGGATRAAVLGFIASSPDFYAFTLSAGQRVSLYGTSVSTLRLTDAGGATLAQAASLSNGGRGLFDYVATVGGTYYASVTPSNDPYWLMVTRDAATSFHNQFAESTPIDVTVSRTILGNFTSTSSQHLYNVQVQAGDEIVVTTATPGDGGGEFVNTLDPMIELRDPAGLLATDDDNEMPDGRNARLSHVAQVSGVYQVRLKSAFGAGAYVLDVDVNPGAGSTFTAAASIADGAAVTSVGSTVQINFSQPVDFTTLAADDVLLDGQPLTGMTVVDRDSATFAWSPTAGAHTLSIAAGAVTDHMGRPLAAFSSTFTLDNVGPRIIGAAFQSGPTAADPLVITIDFNETMAPSVTSGSSVTLLHIASNQTVLPTSNTYDAATSRWQMQRVGEQGRYRLTLVSGNARLEDLLGNDLDGEVTATPLPPNQSGNGTAGGNFVIEFDHIVGAFAVESTNITQGLANAPFIVNFNRPVDAATLAPGDLTVDGVPAEAVTLIDANTASFTLPALSDGPHNVVIAAGEVADYLGNPVDAFSATFTLDVTAPRIVAVSMQQDQIIGSTSPAPITVRFDEAINAAVLGTDDFVVTTSSGSTVTTTFSYDPVTFTGTITLPTSMSEGRYTLRVKSHAQSVKDLAGNLLDGELPAGSVPPAISGDGLAGGDYVLSFVVDKTGATTLHLAALSALTSLASTASATAHFVTAMDTDQFTLDILGGQAVTVVADPQDASQVLKIELFDPADNLVGQAMATGAGATVMLVSAPAAAAGVYTIAVTQTAAGEGRYNVTALLNAVAEIESNGGGGNDDLASAQNLNAAFTEIAGVNRATVVGALEGPPFYTQTNRIAPLQFGTSIGLSFTGTPTPQIGATLTVKAFGDLSGTDEFLNITVAGVTRQVFVTGGSDTQEVTAVIPLTLSELLAARFGTNVSVTFSASLGVGFVANSYADLTLTYDQNPGVGDLYRMDLAAGERLDLAATMAVNAGLSSLFILDAAGVPLHSVQGVSPHLRGFIAPTAGEYYVRISGPALPYTLTATRGAALAVEGTEPIDLTATGKALGDLGSPDAMDSYVVSAITGDVLVIETDVPLVGRGSRMYFADPMLELVDPTGQVVATDLNGAGDGRNARIAHTAAMTGRYTVRVSHENDGAAPGLDASFYNVGPVSFLPSVAGLTPVLVRVDADINYPPVSPDGVFANTGLTNQFAAHWSGKIVAETAGTYVFTLGSDDGSRLTIDGAVVVDNDGLHPYAERIGVIQLLPGVHDIRVEMFDRTGAAGAILFWQQPTQPLREVVPVGVLLHGDPAAGVSVPGAYALSVTGASAPPALRVLSVTPAETMVPSLSQITVQFSEQVSPASIQPGDLTIDGNPAASVTVNDDTAIFTLAAPASPGVHTLAIAGGAVSNPAGHLVEAYTQSVTVDPVAPRVIATSIAANSTITSVGGNFTLSLQFDEPIVFDAGMASRIVGQGNTAASSPSAVSYDQDTRTLTATFDNHFDTLFLLTITANGGGVRDLAGNVLDGDGNGTPGGNYSLAFNIDAAGAFAGGIGSGSQSFRHVTATRSVPGRLTTGDTDTIALNLDAGQLVWVGLRSDSTVTGSVQIFSPDGQLIASGVAPAPGATVEIAEWMLAQAGEYRFVVTGIAPSSGGNYNLDIVVNGVEDVATANTRTSAAENIDSVFQSLSVDASFAWLQRQFGSQTTGNRVYSMSLAAGDVLSVLGTSSSARLRVTDLTGTTLQADATTGSFGNRQIRHFTAPADGVYLVRFDGVSNFDALLGLNIDLETEASAADTSALSINLNGQVLGSISSSTQVDRHRFTLAAGDVVEVTTQTPFDGPFELLNTLNPRLELVDPAGNIVATNLNGAADGRNARIVATALMNGAYLIRIAAESGTGAYLLAAEVVGANVAPTDITLSSQAIAENQPAGTAVGTFVTADEDPGEMFIYTLIAGEGDADNALFTIAGDELVAAVSFDFEARSSYAVRVRSTDRAGFFTEKQFAITVTDVNEDSTPPVIERISVNGGWHADFYAHLGASGVGGTWGYALPEGTDQLRPLTWTGITRVAVHFSENVDVVATDLTLLGVNVADYASRLSPGGFSYDSNTFIAAWTFTAPLTADKLRLLLDDRVADAAGNALDGEWMDAMSTASGDGVAGGDFSYRMNVLPGDVTPSGRVQSGDLITVRNAQFTRPGLAGYSAFLDVDGTANISSSDVIKTRNLQFTRLPDGDPPTSPPTQGGSQPLLVASTWVVEPAPGLHVAPAAEAMPMAAIVDSSVPDATNANTNEPAAIPQSLSAPSVQASQLAAQLATAAQPASAPSRAELIRKPWEPAAPESSLFEPASAVDFAVQHRPAASPFTTARSLARLPAILSFRIRLLP